MTDYCAFDFGGVIGNNAGESGITVWRAAHALWPERVDATLGRISSSGSHVYGR
jgi:hypothetical protein